MDIILLIITSVSLTATLIFGYLLITQKRAQKNISPKNNAIESNSEISKLNDEIAYLKEENSKLIKQSNKKEFQEIRNKIDEEQKNLDRNYANLEEEKIKFKNEQRESRLSVTRVEQSLNDREKNLITRSTNIDHRFGQLQDKENELLNKELEFQNIQKSLESKLNEISNLTKEEAEQRVMAHTEENLKAWIAKRIRESDKMIQLNADNKAQEILIDAMSKASTEYISDVAITRFQLQSDDQKGKIIGKEGRNIKMIERLTGVEVIVDEDNASISISCFDPIRREVAAISIARLLKDGRMHPGTIEDTIESVKKDLLKILRKEGEDLAFKAGVVDLPEELIKLLGKFKYRFSYGQNLARHTIEVIQIAESIAKDLNLDTIAVKTAALLHDIGKVVITDSLGTDERQHHHISAELAKKYGMSDKIVNAIEAHHEDIPSRYLEAEVIKIADAISGARLGARRENYEEYIKRIKALEEISKSYPGVKEAYAIYAGREIRILIEPKIVSDDDITILSQKIAKQIQDTQNYPGTIKVTVIRETRAVATA